MDIIICNVMVGNYVIDIPSIIAHLVNIIILIAIISLVVSLSIFLILKIKKMIRENKAN